ncbi:uncharacterized protein LOC110165467 [Boleophthalmus pectinirostris]|uniref:uncharacterized protein LOC110165467 n=1 Tax=Boleophthalmus pectinirostris TaxID=150288 RepID=UPI00242C063F|nr:uncharacterized protein LOC110165467 [Boleophthalmus pectinirostris]
MADKNPRAVRRKRKPGVEVIERKRKRDKERSQTKVILGDSFQRWRALKREKGLKTDALVAKFLLDSYDNVTSAPLPQTRWVRPPQFSTNVQELFSDRDELTENIDEEEFNSLQNTTIDWDDKTWTPEMETQSQFSSEEDETKDFDSASDESQDLHYTPPICLRAGGALKQPFCVDTLPQIHMDETVHDEPDDCETVEDAVPPDTAMAVIEKDVLGKQASIIYHDVLKQLLDYLILPVDKCTAQDPISKVSCNAPRPFKVSVRRRCTAVIAEWICPNGHTVWNWSSQRYFKCGMLAGDFMLGVNVLLSGSSFRKVALLFKFMNMGMIDPTTFHKIQDDFCVDNITNFWKKDTEGIINELKEKDSVVLLGDGRMDSPGFCAQYCTYTMMDNETKKIVYMHSSDKRETQRNSVTVEKHCFLKCMKEIMKDLTVKEVCTDAHSQISSLFKSGEYKDKGIKHSLDVWHGAKTLSKKILAAGRQKDCSLLLTWNRDITNHFWFCCKTAETYEHFMDLWTGLLHHVTGVHQWCFGSCDHDLLESERNKPLIPKDSVAHQRLRDLMLDLRWLNTVTKFLSFRSTAELESFHNHVSMYAGKRFAFSKKVYEARVHLASLDYNNHLNREPRRRKDGSTQKGKLYNKRTKTWHLYTHKAPKEYKYIPDLQTLILQSRLLSLRGMADSFPSKPDDPQRLGPLTGVQLPSPSPALTPQIKEEPNIKQEEEQLQVCVLAFGAVSVKTEESSLLQQRESEQRMDIKSETLVYRVDTKTEDIKSETLVYIDDTQGENIKSETLVYIDDTQGENIKSETLVYIDDTQGENIKSETLVYIDDTQGEDIKAETHIHSETEGDTEHSSDTDIDEDWRADGNYHNQETRGRRITAQNSRLFPRYTSPQETRATVNTGDMSGADEGADKGPESKIRTCPVCKESFESPYKLQIHKRVHRGEEPLSCSICKKEFAVSSDLKKHMRTHTGERPFTCSVCKKTFSQKGHLELHTRIHTGEKPFSCSVCKKTFTRKDHFETHMSRHTGEKRFSCSICLKVISDSANFKKHLKTHSGERPFSCSVCEKTFARKGHLKTHMMTHTGERPYSCSVCKKTFVVNSNLKIHMRTHTGEKPFSCSVCKKVFTQRSNLKKHTRTHFRRVL